MDTLFDDFGSDFDNFGMGIDGFMNASQSYVDSGGFNALVSAMTGSDWETAFQFNIFEGPTTTTRPSTGEGPELGGQMIGYQVYGDWNGDGIWDIQQGISSIPGALGAWTYAVLLVEAGIDPFTGDAIPSHLVVSSCDETDPNVSITPDCEECYTPGPDWGHLWSRYNNSLGGDHSETRMLDFSYSMIDARNESNECSGIYFVTPTIFDQ